MNAENYPAGNPPAAESAADISDNKLRSKRSRALLVFGVKLAAGIALVGFLLWHYDLRSALQLIRRERPVFFVATVMLYVCGQAMSAYRWRFLAALNGLRGSYSEYLSYYFIGMFTNV